MTFQPPTETVLDRFLRYVKIDTQSEEDSKSYPSTEKQLVLLRSTEPPGDPTACQLEMPAVNSTVRAGFLRRLDRGAFWAEASIAEAH